MKLVRLLYAGSLGLFSLHATAANFDAFNYLGISVQRSSYSDIDFSPGINTANLEPLTLESDTSGIGFRGFLGHQFNSYFAIEAGVSSFGNAEFSLKEAQSDAEGKLQNHTLKSGKFETLAGDIRLIGTYPIGEKLFLKAFVGAYAWDNKFTVLATNSEGYIEQKTSESGSDLLAGVGIGYGLSSNFALSFDYEKTEIASISSQNISLSLLMRL